MRTTSLTRWIRRSHRHTWMPDTRNPEYSVGRLIDARGSSRSL